MRVLLIDVNYKGSSTGRIVFNIFEYLNSNSFDAYVCYGRGAKVNDKKVKKFGFDFETKIHGFITRVFGWTGVASFFSTRRLLRYINDIKPDIINLHEPHAYFLNLKMFFNYIYKYKIPLVYTFHCEFAYTGKCGYAYECEKWKTHCGKCPHLHDYPSTLFFDFTKQMQKRKKDYLLKLPHLAIVCPSTWLANRVKESFLKEKKTIVINNSIDVDSIFYPRETNYLREHYHICEDKIVLSAAPYLMSERKGGKWVIELAKLNLNKSIKFVMVGIDIPLDNLPSNVICIPPVKDPDILANIYSSSDCFVICSSNENFPTTPIESICCGTPVVGFDVGGTKETVPEPFGLFCKYGDIRQLSLNLNKMLSTSIDKKQLNIIRDFYNNERMCKEYISVYKDALKKQ